jgi:two-component system response regulator MprA
VDTGPDRRAGPSPAARGEAAAHVLLVLRDAAEARTLASELRYHGLEPSLAASARHAIALAQAQPPDLVLLDRAGHDLDGLEALRRLLAHRPRTPVILLADAPSWQDEVRSLDLGAADYVRRPYCREVLLARLRAALRRSAPAAAPPVLAFADLRLDLAARTAVRGERSLDLTRQEFELLRRLLGQPGRVFPKLELLEAVWGLPTADANVVEVYVARLRRKLEAGGAPRLIHTVRGVGYTLRLG